MANMKRGSGFSCAPDPPDIQARGSKQAPPEMGHFKSVFPHLACRKMPEKYRFIAYLYA